MEGEGRGRTQNDGKGGKRPSARAPCSWGQADLHRPVWGKSGEGADTSIVALLSLAAVVYPVCALSEEHPDPFSHPNHWLWDFFILTDLFGSAGMDKETDSD